MPNKTNEREGEMREGRERDEGELREGDRRRMAGRMEGREMVRRKGYDNTPSQSVTYLVAWAELDEFRVNHPEEGGGAPYHRAADVVICLESCQLGVGGSSEMSRYT